MISSMMIIINLLYGLYSDCDNVALIEYVVLIRYKLSGITKLEYSFLDVLIR